MQFSTLGPPLSLKANTERMVKELDAYAARLRAAATKPAPAASQKARYRIVRGRLTLVKAGDA